jgi:hypothetical protein
MHKLQFFIFESEVEVASLEPETMLVASNGFLDESLPRFSLVYDLHIVDRIRCG